MCISKKLRVCLALVLVFAVLCMSVGPVYAEAVTLTFTALAVIAAVLTACGIVAGDSEGFTGLCQQVATSLVQSKVDLQIRVLAGVSYISKAAVDAIVLAANSLSAFQPATTQQVATFDGLSYPYFGEIEGNRYNEITNGAAVKELCTVSESVLIEYLHGPIHVYSLPRSDGHYRQIWYDANSTAEEHITSIGSVAILRSKDYCWYRPDLKSYQIGYFYSGVYDNFDVYETVRSVSLQTEKGWSTTDSLPSISADGVVGLGSKWLDRQAALEGVDCLPLSIPADTAAGAAAQTQDEAMAGDKTLGLDKAGVDEATDAEAEDVNKKLKLPATIVECFPFCIPFDVIKGIQLLQAPGVAPKFTLPFSFSYGGASFSHDVVLDLSRFDAQVRIVRWGELLVFVVALAAATKKLIWG